MELENLWQPVASSPTGRISLTCLGVLLTTSIRFSRARSRPTFRSSSRPSSRWSSTPRRPGCSALQCRRRCSPAPTRLLNETARVHHAARRYGGVLIGYAESVSDARAWYAAFREELQKLGWVDGRNIRLDIRWATPDDAEARQRFAKELVALQPDLILSAVTPTTAALLQQTRTIPI